MLAEDKLFPNKTPVWHAYLQIPRAERWYDRPRPGRDQKIKKHHHTHYVNDMCSKTVVCGLHLRNLVWLFILIFVQEQRSKPDQASAWLSETVLILYTVSVSSHARARHRKDAFSCAVFLKVCSFTGDLTSDEKLNSRWIDWLEL